MLSPHPAGALDVERIQIGREWNLQHLETEWNEFVASRFPTFFYRDFAWSRAWWQAYAEGDRVEIYLLRHPVSGSLVAILPFWIRRELFGGFPVRLLENLSRGLGCEDLLIDPEQVESVAGMLPWMLRRIRWDVARFSNLRVEPTTRLMAAQVEGSSLAGEVQRVPRRHIRTVGSFEDYLQGRSGSFRKKNRVASRRAGEMGEISFRRHDLWRMEPEELGKIVGIAKRSWQYRKAGSHFCPVARRSLVEGLVDSSVEPSGQAMVWVMSIGDQDVAFNFCAQSGGRLEGIEQAFVQEFASCSPGRLLMLHVIEDRFRDPSAELFVLGSGEGYLERFTEETEAVTNLVVFRRSLYGRLIPAIRRTRAYRALRRR